MHDVCDGRGMRLFDGRSIRLADHDIPFSNIVFIDGNTVDFTSCITSDVVTNIDIKQTSKTQITDPGRSRLASMLIAMVAVIFATGALNEDRIQIKPHNSNGDVWWQFCARMLVQSPCQITLE